MKKSRTLSPAMTFILMFGMVSLFSDMTHEGAASMRGAYLSFLGASAATIGFVSGLGELVGYAMRYVFGAITDRTGKYWPMVIGGYALDILAVPALALVGEHGWVAASALLIIQRMGKAIKKPAKDTIMSFAASREGAGRSFAIQEVLDQIGAFLGPVLLFAVMSAKSGLPKAELYSAAFAVLAVPGAMTLVLLLVTKRKFPNPEEFEGGKTVYEPLKLKRAFKIYMAGISLFAFGFMDYALILMHITKHMGHYGGLVTTGTLPLIYAGAMLVDAAAAVIFGHLFDKKGVGALVAATVAASPFAILVFYAESLPLLLLGVALWGVGMGAQESVLKAAVATMVDKSARATGYGIFECAFGVFWFMGSWLLGSLYDVNLGLMIAVSVAAQLAAAPLFYLAAKAMESSAKG
ncbi:MFS transporter [Peptoniphilus rachelemmaiella]|uniref:MFS transporter n=1 Tax=Peptoniphilus rachelemmaiella TaxID=2811779 RepID=UPI002040358B|nr:MFS transporter [Peptoniphilus rachelemmaiella]